MEKCYFCENINKNKYHNIICENKNSISITSNYFREGHCTVILKEHKESISEISENEFIDIFKLIKMTSKALEVKYNAEKTYLLSIGDRVSHLHFHLIPKHKNLCSMGEYCFGKLFETEGERNPTKEEQLKLKNELITIISKL